MGQRVSVADIRRQVRAACRQVTRVGDELYFPAAWAGYREARHATTSRPVLTARFGPDAARRQRWQIAADHVVSTVLGEAVSIYDPVSEPDGPLSEAVIVARIVQVVREEWARREPARQLGRRGGAVTSPEKARAARRNGRRGGAPGGRPTVLGTILLVPPRPDRGRLLWQRGSGEVRVAGPGATWRTASRVDAPRCPTLDQARAFVAARWAAPVWGLAARGGPREALERADPAPASVTERRPSRRAAAPRRRLLAHGDTDGRPDTSSQ